MPTILTTPLKETNNIHPWQKTIKDILSNRIKHAHNSVRNPNIPRIKERIPDENRIRFTIIGDRVTKDFIYSVNVVKGLHKYRWKQFDVPSIRGVNTVEWPEIWRSLKIQHGGIAHCLRSPVAVLVNDRLLGGTDELKELVDSKYIYHLILDYYNESVAQFASYIRSSGRPCAYMHFSIDGEHIGTMIFMLYSDIVPYTCENFLRLCKETRGGYSGTPVHRIVKDGWIQCGGFGLKNTDLDCENFIVPHDRRGVLCMANDGRHVDCSTQFFVLLQPAPWMAHRYVAFGQLIEGANTLNKIEQVPTWYESPKAKIIIDKAGIFNMECQAITINKGTMEYLHGHIEDLVALGDLLIETLIERVFLEIELKLVEQMHKEIVLLEEEEEHPGKDSANIHATKRFIRKKEEIQSQIQSKHSQHQSTKTLLQEDEENEEFDVERYEPEETYQHLSLPPSSSSSIVVKPERPYYLAFTDVPYPGERDSIYDLKKFLQGDYCLESDLPTIIKKEDALKKTAFPPDLIDFISDDDAKTDSSESIDSEEEREIKAFLQSNADRCSFGGGVIRNIARTMGISKFLEDNRTSETMTDEALRKIRRALHEIKSQETREKKVSISIPPVDKKHSKIKRRQTGFVRPEDLEKIIIFKNSSSGSIIEDNDDTARKVRIDPSVQTSTIATRPTRRPTSFRPADSIISDTDTLRPSVLQRLYDDVNTEDDVKPILKDYKPSSEHRAKNVFLTESLRPTSRINNNLDASEDKVFRRSSANLDSDAYFENVSNTQHDKKVARKISSDHVRLSGRSERRFENSLRSSEYAKSRPSISVSAYQLKNQKHQQEMKNSETKMSKKDLAGSKMVGLRLPGDTPLYSSVELRQSTVMN